MFDEGLLCARYYSKTCTRMISFNDRNSLIRKELLLAPFYR